MSVLAGVFDDLNHMSQLQLLLAFSACIAAALTLGGLLPARARALAGGAALGSTLGFVAFSSSWPNAVMLAAVAVVGLGLFVAAVWVMTRLTGLEPRGRNAALPPDSLLPADAATPIVRGGTAPLARPKRIAST